MWGDSCTFDAQALDNDPTFKDRYAGASHVQMRSHDTHSYQIKGKAKKAFELWDQDKNGLVDECELAAYYYSQSVPT